MVLEVFAAISLASNILQFVDFGGKLFTKAREVHHSADGTTKDYAYLEAATERLKRLKDDLDSSASTVSRAVDNSGEDRELKILAKDCTDLADELSNLLEKLKGRKRKRKRGSFLQAIQLTLNENEINDAKSRLKEFQTRVTVSLSNILRNNQSVVIKVLMELSNHVHEGETRAKDLLTMKADVISKLNDIIKQSDGANKTSDELSSKLSDIASTLSKWAATGNQFAAEHRILKSLRFRCMDVRHAQITEAHSKTFEWAYTSRSNSDSSCTQFKFAEWLRSGNGHYWVAGKAGSGKSTLMKFLYDNPRTISELKLWSEQKDLVTACFFFWNSGTEQQKSVEGLLQSLLYEILRKCPSLIPIAAPKRWEERYSYHSEPAHWFQREMKDAFRRIQEQGTFSAKFCLFIDGLDEYGGDHPDLISILQDLTTCENFKLCISSRPWNIFRDAFGQDPERRLFLEELTKPDIELYVRDKLESSPWFMSLLTTDTRYAELVEEVVHKADGVFLWVYLVVGSLLQGLINCDRFSELERRIRLLPSTLEEYFMQTFSTTDEAYSERAAETFAIALQAPYSLSLITYSYIDEEDPYYGINSDIRSLSPQETMGRLRTMKRRINARCNGLLEVKVYHRYLDLKMLLWKAINDQGWSGAMNDFYVQELFESFRVEFLHRTVRDFLNTEYVQNLIKQRISSGFQPLSAVCRAILAEIKAFPMDEIKNVGTEDDYFGESIQDVFFCARISEEKFQRPETKILDELERTLLVFSPVWRIEKDLETVEDLIGVAKPPRSYFEYVVQYGLCGYVSSKLCSPLDRRSRPSISKLLSAALVPTSVFGSGLCYFPSIVELLIRSSEDERTETWTRVELTHIWVDFLLQIPEISNLLSIDGKNGMLQIIRILLDIGANPRERHNGCLIWESALQELERICGEPHRVSGNGEMLEFIESYKNIFLACGAGSHSIEEVPEASHT